MTTCDWTNCPGFPDGTETTSLETGAELHAACRLAAEAASAVDKTEDRVVPTAEAIAANAERPDAGHERIEERARIDELRAGLTEVLADALDWKWETGHGVPTPAESLEPVVDALIAYLYAAERAPDEPGTPPTPA